MDVREKLIELIESARYWGTSTSEEIADSLLANCVTFQRWIPVTERLPEKGKYVLAYSVDDDYTTVEARNKFEVLQITHWMPLPQPPKEDTCESKHTKP